MPCSIYDYKIHNINKDIKNLQMNIKMSLKDNDVENYSSIVEDLRRKHKDLKRFIKLKKNYDFQSLNYDNKKEFLNSHN